MKKNYVRIFENIELYVQVESKENIHVWICFDCQIFIILVYYIIFFCILKKKHITKYNTNTYLLRNNICIKMAENILAWLTFQDNVKLFR